MLDTDAIGESTSGSAQRPGGASWQRWTSRPKQRPTFPLIHTPAQSVIDTGNRLMVSRAPFQKDKVLEIHFTELCSGRWPSWEGVCEAMGLPPPG